MSLRVLEEDFKILPESPFSMFMLDENGQVSPKRIFTATKKRINFQSMQVEVYVRELNEYVPFIEGKAQVVMHNNPN